MADLEAKPKQLQEKLQQLECPLSWNDKLNEASNATSNETHLLEDKYEEVKNDNHSCAWNKIILKLTLCFLYFNSNDSKKSKTALNNFEELINIYATPDTLKELPIPVKNAMEHIIWAMKAYFLYYSAQFEHVEKILNSIKDKGQMDEKTKAAILGIKAAILIEFPPRGSELAVSVLKDAISLDPGPAEWHFLLGKCLGRIRREIRDYALPTFEEIEALRKATQIGNSATHIIFLAQTYRELAQNAYYKNLKYLPTFNCSVHDITELSYRHYNKALDLEPENCSVNNRCALGFPKFPPPFKNLEQAKICADKALSLSPNSPFVNETAGLLYYKLGDIPKALEYLTIGAELGSYMSYFMLIKIKYRQDSTWDPLPTLQDMQKKFSKVKVKEIEILCNIGLYYLLTKNNFNMASKYWVDAIHLDPECKKLKEHRSSFHKKETTVNIYDTLLTESQKRIRTVRNEEERSQYENIIELCSKYAK